MSPLVLFVSGPYRDARGPWFIEQNIRQAEAVALELWQHGYATICPHKNTAMYDGAAPDDVWLEGDLLIVERCDALILAPGWERSSGTRGEIAHAEEHGIPRLEFGTVDFWRALEFVEPRYPRAHS